MGITILHSTNFAFLEFLPMHAGFPLQRMGLGRGLGVLSPHLDGLVSLAADEPQTCLVECRCKDSGLSVQRSRLSRRVEVLVAVSCLPVPEGEGAVVAAGEEDVVLVDGEGVDDSVLAFEVLHEGPLGAFPLLDASCATAGKGPFCGVDGQGADALLVVCE